MYSLRDLVCISATMILIPAGLFFSKSIRLPVLSKLGKLFIVVMVGLVSYLIFFLPSDLGFFAYLSFVGAIGLIVFDQLDKGESSFLLRLSQLVLVSAVLMLLVSSAQLFYSHWDASFFERYKRLGLFSGFFGNINIFAQFISLTLPFQLYLLFSKGASYRRTCIVSLLGSVAMISFTFCRSAMLGSTISLILFFLYNRQFKIFAIVIIPYLVTVNLVLAPLVSPNYVERSESKSSTVLIRLALLESGLKVSRDFPMGMGVGKYAFNTTPYRYKEPLKIKPDYNERSPHFEPIKWLIEGGVVGSLLFTIPLLVFIARFFWSIRLGVRPNDLLIVAIILTLVVEALTQFPFEMIHPLTALAISLGYMGHKTLGAKRYRLDPKKNLLLLVVGLLISALLFFNVHNIKQIDLIFPNLQTHGCQNRLVDWRRCLDFSKAILRVDSRRSDEILQSLVYNNPFNTFITNEVSFRQRLNGMNNLSCKGAAIQREIYGGYSFFGKTFWQSCDQSAVPKDSHVLTHLNTWVSESNIKIHPVFQSTLKNYEQ